MENTNKEENDNQHNFVSPDLFTDDEDDSSAKIVVDTFFDDEHEIVKENEKASRLRPATREILDWLKHIVLAVLAGLFVVLFVVQRNEVVGSSMVPTLHDKDQLFVQKVSKLLPRGIARRDIITVDAHGLYSSIQDKNIIKRVIGIPGDSIYIHDDKVFVNGVVYDEPYLEESTITSPRNPIYSHVELKDNEYYVLGDNREGSLDSRTFGPVTRDRINGEVLIRFMPFDDFGKP